MSQGHCDNSAVGRLFFLNTKGIIDIKRSLPKYRNLCGSQFEFEHFESKFEAEDVKEAKALIQSCHGDRDEAKIQFVANPFTDLKSDHGYILFRDLELAKKCAKVATPSSQQYNLELWHGCCITGTEERLNTLEDSTFFISLNKLTTFFHKLKNTRFEVGREKSSLEEMCKFSTAELSPRFKEIGWKFVFDGFCATLRYQGDFYGKPFNEADNSNRRLQIKFQDGNCMDICRMVKLKFFDELKLKLIQKPKVTAAAEIVEIENFPNSPNSPISETSEINIEPKLSDGEIEVEIIEEILRPTSPFLSTHLQLQKRPNFGQNSESKKSLIPLQFSTNDSSYTCETHTVSDPTSSMFTFTKRRPLPASLRPRAASQSFSEIDSSDEEAKCSTSAAPRSAENDPGLSTKPIKSPTSKPNKRKSCQSSSSSRSRSLVKHKKRSSKSEKIRSSSRSSSSSSSSSSIDCDDDFYKIRHCKKNPKCMVICGKFYTATFSPGSPKIAIRARKSNSGADEKRVKKILKTLDGEHEKKGRQKVKEKVATVAIQVGISLEQMRQIQFEKKLRSIQPQKEDKSKERPKAVGLQTAENSKIRIEHSMDNNLTENEIWTIPLSPISMKNKTTTFATPKSENEASKEQACTNTNITELARQIEKSFELATYKKFEVQHPNSERIGVCEKCSGKEKKEEPTLIRRTFTLEEIENLAPKNVQNISQHFLDEDEFDSENNFEQFKTIEQIEGNWTEGEESMDCEYY